MIQLVKVDLRLIDTVGPRYAIVERFIRDCCLCACCLVAGRPCVVLSALRDWRFCLSNKSLSTLSLVSKNIMSRHRNVRNLTEDDYYDDYDDYYDDEEYYEEEDYELQQEYQPKRATTTATVVPPQQSLPQQTTTSLAEKERSLVGMGFTKAQAKTALAECKGDVERATDLLVRTAHAMASFDNNMKPPPSIVNSEPTVAKEDISSVAPPTAPEMSVPNTRRPKSKSPTPPLRKPDVVRVPLPKIPSEVMTKIQSQKSRLSMVVLGHVDAGKSTLMGMVLLKLGLVQKRTVQKYQKQAAEVGKASFHLAWVMDEDESERERGVTMDVATKFFSTPSHDFTLLDAPGHAAFVPNMITGAASAQVGILVVAATRGEFEAGFMLSKLGCVGGQTREHVVLARGLGVSQLIVAVNKLDVVDWSQERFDEIKGMLEPFLVENGFHQKRIRFVPTSGLTGINVKDKPSSNVKLSEWYKGPTLLEAIDSFAPAQRNVGMLLIGSSSLLYYCSTLVCLCSHIPVATNLWMQTSHCESL